MKKSYVVRVKSPSDWSEIHNLLLLDGTLEDNIPSRACECVDAKEVYGDKATYLLDEEEVELIKQNPKVKYVELDPSIHPEAYESVELDAYRFENPVSMYRGVDSLNPETSPPKGTTNLDNTVVYDSSITWEDNSGTSISGLNLDISYFPGGGHRPTIVGIHGGLFYTGDKNSFDGDTQSLGSDKGKFFTDLGFNYVSLNYRLTRNSDLVGAVSGTTVNPAALDFTDAAWTGRNKGEQGLTDLAKALNVICEPPFANKYGIDTNNIVLFGHSAGAFYATLLGTSSDALGKYGVNPEQIKGVIAIDTENFDLSNYLTGLSSTETGLNEWGFMNAWGVNPDINPVDFSTLDDAKAYWDTRSPIALLQDTSKNETNYAKSFCIVTRGVASKVQENEDLKDKLIAKGVPTTYLAYPGSISGNRTGSGTITYTHEGIQEAIGHNDGDLENTDDDLVTLGISNVTTEITNYLASVVVPLAEELNRSSWHLTRPQSKESTWSSSNNDFVTHVDPFTNGTYNHLNMNFVGIKKELNPEYILNETGKHVDCVVIDNGAWHGHPEFVDSSGVSQIKDLILDGPFYIDPDYFTSNSKTTIFLGRTTCTETAAKEWWTDSTKRSSSFSSTPTLSSSTIPAVYTRAAMCGSYSAYPSHSSVETDFANHGTPVASAVYGKNFGWAFEANKWNVAANAGQSSVINVEKIYEILKIFVDNKPSVNGIKYPTIINTSYGLVTTVANEWAAGTYYFKFRNEAIGSFTSKATAPQFLKNFIDNDNSRYAVATSSSSHQDAGDTLANTAGVVWIASAGNSNQLQANPGDSDYNNYWSTVDPDGGSFVPATDAKYVNRRGSPANFGYDSATNSYKVISAGALSGYLDAEKKEGKDWYSNSGPGVDILSPASGGLVAAGNSNQEDYPRYDSQNFYSWLSKDAYDCEIGGTSTASPVFAGFIASKLSSLYYWGARSVKKYIEGVMQTQNPATFESGYGVITTSNSSEWDAYDNLHGQSPKIVYNAPVTNISFTRNLPSVIEIKNLTDSVILDVINSSPLADSYNYQWQSSLSGNSWSNMSGETSSSLTFSTIDDTITNKFYRVEVTSNGPYKKTYSAITELKFAPTKIEIVTQPSSISTIQGSSQSLYVSAKTTSTGDIDFEWQKYNETTDSFEEVTGSSSNKGTDFSYSTLPFNNIQVASEGRYRCVITDGISSAVTSEEVSISVTVPELEFTLEPLNQSVYVGNSVILEVDVRSTTNSTIAFQWQFSTNETTWKNIPNEKDKKLILANLDISESGYYRCRATDNVSNNSPLFSTATQVIVKEVTIEVGTDGLQTSVIEGQELLLNVQVSLNDSSRRPSFSFQKKETINGNVVWNIVDVNDDGQFYIEKIQTTQAGEYRCVISDPIASNSPKTVSPINVTVLPSFEVTTVTSSPSTATVDSNITLIPTVRIINDKLAYYYIWERKENGSDEWKVINEAQEKAYTFKATGADYLDKFRCRVFNNLNTVKYTTPDFQLSFNPFVDVAKEPQKLIKFKENSQQIHVLDPEVVSTHASTLSYIWQKSLDYTIVDEQNAPPATWTDITTETNKKIELTPGPSGKLIQFNSGNTDDFYYLRLKINFGHNDTYIFSEPTKIDLKDVFNLFGDCLSKEAADNLYDTDLIDSRDPHGNESLPDRQYIETINVDPVDPTDKCKDKNTCGISIKELFDTYPIYNTQKGLYKSWGDIEFLWQLEEARLRDLTPKPLPTSWDSLLWDSPGTTCNLNIEVDYTTGQGDNPPSDPNSSTHPDDYIIKSTISESSETNDKWQVAQYKALYAYFPKIGSGGLTSPADATCLTERPADRVLRIEDDGYRVCLYEAQELVTALSGPFDKTKWAQICCIITSIPAGLPTPEEIKERYEPYELDFFLDEWGEYNATWNEDFYQQSFDDCMSTNSVLADVEKCLKEKTGPYGQSNDQWGQARIKKEFFYRVGDYVWIEGECKDTVCLYICIQDIPATEVIFNELKQFKPRLKPSSEITNYTITVQAADGGNRYFIDGSQQPALNLREGQTYRFRQDDSSNANHPIRFSTTPDGTHGGGVEYTEGVTKVGTAGTNGAYTEITVPKDAPTLYYYCVNHSSMGGTANTLGLAFWERVYCVNTGMNKCLEPQRERDLPNYQLVELGSMGHYVEQPIPFFDLKGNKLCNDFDLLNNVVEEEAPKTLTQEEIDALDQP